MSPTLFTTVPFRPDGPDAAVLAVDGLRVGFACCTLPLIPLRAQPSEKAEQVTQVLHGQYLLMLEQQDAWVKVRVLDDGYEGWCAEKMVHCVEQSSVLAALSEPSVLTLPPLSRCETVMGPASLPAGSRLLEGERVLAAMPVPSSAFGTFKTDTGALIPAELALGLLNAPYLWGGKSVLGVDCSGLIQVVHALCGTSLPRDASQQVSMGIRVPSLDEAAAGDLAFFQNEAGNVVHVGLLLDKKRIVHASGWVRIDAWDEQGVFDEARGVYTHRFHQLRRL